MTLPWWPQPSGIRWKFESGNELVPKSYDLAPGCWSSDWRCWALEKAQVMFLKISPTSSGTPGEARAAAEYRELSRELEVVWAVPYGFHRARLPLASWLSETVTHSFPFCVRVVLSLIHPYNTNWIGGSLCPHEPCGEDPPWCTSSRNNANALLGICWGRSWGTHHTFLRELWPLGITVVCQCSLWSFWWTCRMELAALSNSSPWPCRYVFFIWNQVL